MICREGAKGMARRKSRYVFSQYRETHRVRNFFIAVETVMALVVIGTLAFNFAISRQVRPERQKVTLTNLPVDLKTGQSFIS